MTGSPAMISDFIKRRIGVKKRAKRMRQSQYYSPSTRIEMELTGKRPCGCERHIVLAEALTDRNGYTSRRSKSPKKKSVEELDENGEKRYPGRECCRGKPRSSLPVFPKIKIENTNLTRSASLNTIAKPADKKRIQPAQ